MSEGAAWPSLGGSLGGSAESLGIAVSAVVSFSMYTIVFVRVSAVCSGIDGASTARLAVPDARPSVGGVLTHRSSRRLVEGSG